MSRFSLVSIAFSLLAAPVPAQVAPVPLPQLLEQTVVSSSPSSVAERESAFPALAALPADTDSFLAVGRLGELAALAGGADAAAGVPVAAMAQGLESLALGVSRDAARDLQHLAPLLELMSQSQPGWKEEWMNQAEPGAALAIVAQQREEMAQNIEQLVQYTKNFRLSPIYVVLTARPEMQMLLHQASMLPLLIPVEPGGPVELTARGAWRGFCIKGNLVDLSEAGLSAEQERLLKENLENVRVYVMARVMGDKLVLAITSDLAMVKLPSAPEKSLLASEKLNSFDSCMKKSPWAVGYTSPELVNLSERLDSNGYRSVARFVGNVLRRSGKQDERCARAAVALDSLMQSVAALVPPSRHPEQIMVWQDDALYVHVVTDARGYSFAPGALSLQSASAREHSILFAESTPVAAASSAAPDFAGMLDNFSTVMNGCKATLREEHAAGTGECLARFEQARPGLEKLAAGVQKLSASLTGAASLQVLEQPAEASHPVRFSLRAGVADAAGLDEACSLISHGVEAFCPQKSDCPALHVQHDAQSLVVSSAPGGLEQAESVAAVPVAGGAVFALHVPALARVLKRAGEEHAEDVELLAEVVETVEGAMRVSDQKLYTVFRLQFRQQN